MKIESEKKECEKKIANITEENLRIETENKNFHRELNFASELQKNLLPKSFPFNDKIKIITKYLPSAYIGGDFYDIVQLNENMLAFIIMDVSGHGVKSAIIASMIKAIFQREMKSGDKIKNFFYKMNTEFQENIKTDDYLTSFLMTIDLKNKRLTYSNAAHPNPFLIKTNGDIVELETNGFIIGILDKNFYGENSCSIEQGDKIVLYTDGIIETMGQDEEPFGKKRLKEILKDNSFEQIEDIADTIMTELIIFSISPIFEDDLTLVIMEII